jgi:hypothetical protein
MLLFQGPFSRECLYIKSWRPWPPGQDLSSNLIDELSFSPKTKIHYRYKMGAYVSITDCQAHYNITLNCSVTTANDNTTVLAFGDYTRGEFPGDPDVAGIGVCYLFSLLLNSGMALTWIDRRHLSCCNIVRAGHDRPRCVLAERENLWI